MQQESLKDVVGRPITTEFVLSADEVSYHGSVIPLTGTAKVTISHTGIEANITDRTGWLYQALKALPPGFTGDLGRVFRESAPGALPDRQQYGNIETSVEWRANDVVYFEKREDRGQGDYEATFRFTVGEVIVDGPAVGAQVHAVRSVYRRGAFNLADKLGEHLVVTCVLSADDAKPDDELMAVTFDWIPDDLTQESVWHVINLLVGNTTRCLATEYLAENGELVYTSYRTGNDSRDMRQRFFHRLYRDYGQLAAGGFSTLTTGIRKLLEDDFPIDVILHHLHVAAGETPDIEAQHLVLAIHTAIEAWTRHCDRERWMDDKSWKKIQKALREPMKSLEVFIKLCDDLKANVRSAMARANDTTTAWRQDFLFASLRIDVTDGDNARALKSRNEILHNGYFLRRWGNLTHEERQKRIHDVERLRRLTLLIIFKLTGYTGDFRNPVTCFREHVDSTGFTFPDKVTAES
jgi:hypothetical protein